MVCVKYSLAFFLFFFMSTLVVTNLDIACWACFRLLALPETWHGLTLSHKRSLERFPGCRLYRLQYGHMAAYDFHIAVSLPVSLGGLCGT